MEFFFLVLVVLGVGLIFYWLGKKPHQDLPLIKDNPFREPGDVYQYQKPRNYGKVPTVVSGGTVVRKPHPNTRAALLQKPRTPPAKQSQWSAPPVVNNTSNSNDFLTGMVAGAVLDHILSNTHHESQQDCKREESFSSGGGGDFGGGGASGSWDSSSNDSSSSSSDSSSSDSSTSTSDSTY